MPILTVVPQDVFDLMQNEGIELSKLNDVNYMAEHLAASDIADIHHALKAFPFQFSDELEIQLSQSPFARLALDEKYADLYYRVNGRIETTALRNEAEAKQNVFSYTLYPVEENLWVAVQQRLHNEPGDPNRLLLKANTGFFDAVIEQALHTQSFERVCSTNLFTYYLGSL
jgi:hypothetical protein